MKRWMVLIGALLLCAAPAAAQPARFGDAAQALYAKAHLSGASSDEDKRVVTIQLAEQMAFEFPNEGWGAKTAGPGRPISKDCVAKVESLTGGTSIVKGVCYDWILGGAAGGVKLPPIVNDIPGQVFVPVAAVDHLGAVAPPPPPPPPASDLETRLAALEARVATLEAVTPPVPPVTTPAPPASDLAADVKRIREMLEMALKRFGLQ